MSIDARPTPRSAALRTLPAAVVAALALAPAPLAAQARLAPAGFARHAPAAAVGRDTTLADPAARTRRSRALARGLVGTLGAVGGTFAGIAIANALPHGPCGCDDPGLSQALFGGAIGMAAGGTLAAGALPLGDGCSLAPRLGAASVGGLLGTLGGAIATIATRGIAIPLMPIGAGFGAGYSSTLCRR